tara:strand:- start:1680 stop:1976 length:297 start_codon:yes stop_codon:yes gene_type:complete
MLKILIIALSVLCYPTPLFAGGGIKYVVELRIYHYASDDEPEKITHQTGKQRYDTVGQCAKDRLSPEFKLGLKAYYHGKGVAMIESRCKMDVPEYAGA